MADSLTATIPDPELEKLEAMAVEHDTQASQELSAQEPEAAQPAAEKEEPKTEEQTPDNSEVETAKPERPRDELGRFTKTEAGDDIPEAERQPVEKPAEPSEYEAKRQEKARKEAERLEKTWQNVDLRKQELERREREIAEREQALLQRQQPQVQPQQRDFSSRELFHAAQDFRARAETLFEEGDIEGAKENARLAKQAEEHAQQFYQVEAREAQQAQVQQYNQVWSGNMQKAIEAEPDLIKADSPLAKALHSLLETHGEVFWMIPDGFPKAVEIAKLRLEAGSASELRDKLTKAEKEVARLTKATTPLGAGPTPQIQHKKLDDLPIDEQLNELERMAERADREAFANA
jgi:hypothetical protein